MALIISAVFQLKLQADWVDWPNKFRLKTNRMTFSVHTNDTKPVKRNGFLTDRSKGCSGRQLRQCIACHPTRRSWEKLSFVRWSGSATGFCPCVDPRP